MQSSIGFVMCEKFYCSNVDPAVVGGGPGLASAIALGIPAMHQSTMAVTTSRFQLRVQRVEQPAE